jgi:hypothetical protein
VRDQRSSVLIKWIADHLSGQRNEGGVERKRRFARLQVRGINEIGVTVPEKRLFIEL